MSGSIDAERVLDAFLAPEHDQLPSWVVDAALADIETTPQRRALRAPWRFNPMTSMQRVAAVAIVAIVGVGALAFTFRGPGGGTSGAALTPTLAPTPSPAPTPAPTPTPTATPSEVAPGITGFTPYTSEVYGLTFGVPDNWVQEAKATLKWQEGIAEDAQYQDLFVAAHDGPPDGGVAFLVFQRPAGPGADIASHDGLTAWVAANDRANAKDVAVPLCVGKAACGPAVLLPGSDGIAAYIADPDAGVVTIVLLGRADDHPATARYGGGIRLLESILTTFDVWTPEPGQIPEGS